MIPLHAMDHMPLSFVVINANVSLWYFAMLHIFYSQRLSKCLPIDQTWGSLSENIHDRFDVPRETLGGKDSITYNGRDHPLAHLIVMAGPGDDMIDIQRIGYVIVVADTGFVLIISDSGFLNFPDFIPAVTGYTTLQDGSDQITVTISDAFINQTLSTAVVVGGGGNDYVQVSGATRAVVIGDNGFSTEYTYIRTFSVDTRMNLAFPHSDMNDDEIIIRAPVESFVCAIGGLGDDLINIHCHDCNVYAGGDNVEGNIKT
jgi:hypothetical protein